MDNVWPGAQEGWRYCHRCQRLVFGDGGTCFDAQRHDVTGSAAYSVPFFYPHDQHIDVFVPHWAGVSMAWWSLGRAWSSVGFDWFYTAGPQNGSVTLISRAPEIVDAFGISKAGEVFTDRYRMGQGWASLSFPDQHWERIGTGFPSGALISATARTPGNLDVFAARDDGHVYTSWWSEGARWSDWQDLGGVFPAGAPVTALARAQDHLDLFVIGNDGHIYTCAWTAGSAWTGLGDRWRDLGGNGRPHGKVAATTRFSGNIDLFVVGDDGRVYTSWWYEGSEWSGLPRPGSWGGSGAGGGGSSGNRWTSLGGFFPPGATITAIARDRHHLDLFVVGNDGQVYTSWWVDGGGWSGVADNWLSLGGEFPKGAHIAATSRDPGNIDLFAIGSDKNVRTKWWTVGAGWADWLSLGSEDFTPGGRIAAVARVAGVRAEGQVEPIRLHIDVNTDDSTAARGWAELTLYVEGTFSFVTHFHATGWNSYPTSLAWFVFPADGRLPFLFTHDGKVYGTDEIGPRDDDNTVNGSSPAMRDRFASFRNCTYRWAASFKSPSINMTYNIIDLMNKTHVSHPRDFDGEYYDVNSGAYHRWPPGTDARPDPRSDYYYGDSED
ncbi:hypothetical protein [Nocardia tenerifensis]|nr:hypothetical protein [Nocardia tenerifensis]